MIIPARKQFRWRVWLMGYAIILVIVFFLSVGAYRTRKSPLASPVSRVVSIFFGGLLPTHSTSTPTPTPVTPQKTSEFFRGAYGKLDKDTLELNGTAGTTEKIKIGDHTEFTCAPRYIRNATGTAVDMTNVFVTVQSKGNYTARSSSASTFLSRLMFESTVQQGNIVLVTLDTVPDNPAIRVSLMTDPCNPDKWKL